MLLAAVLAGIFPGGAAAADRTRRGRVAIGPFYVTPVVELSAGAESNLFLTPTDPIGDLTGSLRPSLSFALSPGSRLRSWGTGALGLEYFRIEAAERYTSLFGTVGGEVRLSRFTLAGGYAAQRTRERFRIDLDERLERREARWAAGASWRLSHKLSLALRARERTQALLGAAPDLRFGLDQSERVTSLEIRRALTGRTTFLAAAEKVQNRFLHQAVDGPDRSRSLRTWGGFEFSDRALLNGSVLFGYRFFPDSRSQATPAYHGPVVAVEAALRIRDRARLKINVSRDLLFGSASDRDQDPLRELSVSGVRRGDVTFGLPFDLVASSYLEHESLSPVSGSALASHVARDAIARWTIGGRLLKPIRRSLRVSGHVEWVHRLGQGRFESFTNLGYGVQVEFRP